MNTAEKWESVYRTKPERKMSWYRPHLEASLARIERVAGDRAARIVDIGGGASTLVDDLLARGYRDITVLDVSETALGISRRRLGSDAERIHWVAADIMRRVLPNGAYDVWHDRAFFHFLVTEETQRAYVEAARAALKSGGHLILGIFGPEGPARCSGQDVARYDAAAIEARFAPSFCLDESGLEWHTTPAGVQQQFTYCTLHKA